MTSASGPPPNRRSGSPLTLVAVASVALVAGVGGAALATASTASSATSPAATPAPVTSATRVAAGSTGIGSVKTGNQVAVTATVHGSAASLTRVLDLSLLRGGRSAAGWGRQPATAG